MGHEISWEPKGVVKRFFGNVTNEDLMKSSSMVQSDIRFDDLKYEIVDFTGLTSHSVSDPEVLEVAAIDEVAFESRRFGLDQRMRIRIAIIATNPAIISLAEKYTNCRSDSLSCRIFPGQADARRWLGSPG